MAAPICAIVTTSIGTVLIVIFAIIGYVVIPNIIHRIVSDQVGIIEDTIQMERFKNIPFHLDFKVRLFEIKNPEGVKNNEVPVVQERGPYVYKLNRSRIIHEITDEYISYQIMDQFEFDSEASYPNTEDDVIMLLNAPYNLILQLAESDFSGVMGLIGGDDVLQRVFGDYATPVAEFRVGDILFDGVAICTNPTLVVAPLFCNAIRISSDRSENLQVQPDGSVLFSFFAHKQGRPGRMYKVNRGTIDVSNLGIIFTWDNSTRLHVWADEKDEDGEEQKSVCNKLNGTDTGIFPPFVDTSKPLFGFNTDICRSVELRYVGRDEYKEIPVLKYSADEWFLDNNDGCFCINKTRGLTKANGCLHRGAIELYNCVGGHMILSYPHFLFAHSIYRNGIVGNTPIEDEHKIELELEETSGVVIRGFKRAQFNLFSRAIESVRATENLRTTLTPVFWVHEGMELPQEFVDEIKQRVFQRLRAVDILRPTLLAIGGLVLILGIVLIILRCRSRSVETVNVSKSQ